MYGADAFAIKLADLKTIDVFEMWYWRRMLRISWTKKRTNAEIGEKVPVKGEADSLEKLII